MKDYTVDEIMAIMAKIARKYPKLTNQHPNAVRDASYLMGLMLVSGKPGLPADPETTIATWGTAFYMGGLLARYSDVRMFKLEKVTEQKELHNEKL